MVRNMTEKPLSEKILTFYLPHERGQVWFDSMVAEVEALEAEAKTLKEQNEKMLRKFKRIPATIADAYNTNVELESRLAKAQDKLREICSGWGTDGCDETCDCDPNGWAGCYTRMIGEALGRPQAQSRHI